MPAQRKGMLGVRLAQKAAPARTLTLVASNSCITLPCVEAHDDDDGLAFLSLAR